MRSPEPLTRWQHFIALHWYEETIRFLFQFAAKTSELLLAAGLVVSTANFLTDGAVMGANIPVAQAWAWAQALAIDSSLGVTFYDVFQSVRQRDWIKAACYAVLTTLLAVVAGAITNVDTLSHALHTSMSVALAQVGLNVHLLTTLRSIAVVGFVMMSRLRQVSFKTLTEENHHLETPGQWGSEQVAQLVVERLQKQKITIVEEDETEKEPEPSPVLETRAPLRLQETPVEPEHSQHAEAVEQRLLQAYQELVAEGLRISARTLAAHAHMHRSTCSQWLKARQQT